MAYENQERFMAVAIGNRLALFDTGTPAVQIKFGIVHSMSNPDITQTVLGERTLWWTGFLSENTYERTLEILAEVFGYDGSVTDISEINNNTELFANIQAIIVTEPEEYNGHSRSKIKFVNHPDRGGVKPLDEIEATRISKELSNKLKAFSMKNKGQTGQPSRSSVPPARNVQQNSRQSSGNGYRQNNPPSGNGVNSTGTPPPYNDDDLPF